MEEDNNQDDMLILVNKRRHFSQIPISSNDFILKKSPQGYKTICSIRNRRTVSEQINRHDR